MTKEYIVKEIYNKIGRPQARRLDYREVIDGLTDTYYRLEEVATTID